IILGNIIEELNHIEIALLILAAYLHDQGMIIEKEEYEELKNKQEFLEFRDNWYIDHKNYNEIKKQLNDNNISPEEKEKLSQKLAELDSAMLTEYIRTTHGERSGKYVREEYAEDDRLKVERVNLTNLTAKLCASHCYPAKNLILKNGFDYNKRVGQYSINMPYLAVVLRLADILDFDRDRAPDILYRSIHFTNEVSIKEWEKHRAVQGWEINSNMIRFNMEFEHPVYEKVAKNFMDKIDKELSSCHEVCRKFPGEFDNYKLLLPQKVDRSRMGPKNNLYIYHDLKFSLSRDEVVNLLMTNELYNSPSLCIRELLQNSLDALRYRKAMYKCEGVEWGKGKIEMKHFVNENGHEVIKCEDNGTGMDEEIITKYFAEVGRSYYRSPEFEQIRAKFRNNNVDFDPCSQFGIGFMSCFMLGERIKIETKKDYGPKEGYGKSLIVEINGLGGMLVIKEGDKAKPGTTVTIISRKKPAFFDEFVDQVRLIPILKGYALANEFPIYGKCNVDEIEDEVEIPPEIKNIPTFFEYHNMEDEDIVTFKQEFSEIDERLNGFIRESFLVDEEGIPTISNNKGTWKASDSSKDWDFYIEGNKSINNMENKERKYPLQREATVCIDGILLGGPPGRTTYTQEIDRFIGWRTSHIYNKSPVLIDVRKELKPDITPSRKPIRHAKEKKGAGYNKLQQYVDIAAGRIWENVIKYLDKGLSYEEFWKLSVIYRSNFLNIIHKKLWEFIAVSLVNSEKKSHWKKVCNIKKVSIEKINKELEYEFITRDDYKIKPFKELKNWEKKGERHPSLSYRMKKLIVLMGTITIENEKVKIKIDSPQNLDEILSKFAPTASHGGVISLFTKYSDEISDVLTVQTYFANGNKNHPLVKEYLQSRFLSQKNNLQKFVSTFISGLTKAVSLSGEDITINNPGRALKLSGHRYFLIDWSKYNNVLKPPYKIWLQDKGCRQITENDFKKWKNS
ncbi:MAG: HD domain-containing protein, partial [Candidatus Woesearchaeota archaeon]